MDSQLPPAALSVLYPHPAHLPLFQGDFNRVGYEQDAMRIQKELEPRFCGGLWPRLVITEQTLIEEKRFASEPSLPKETRKILGQSCDGVESGLITLADFQRIVDLSDGKLDPDGNIPPQFRFSFLGGPVKIGADGSQVLDSVDMAAPWRWHVVSFRYLPCAFEQGGQSTCLPELRVVAQPILAYGPLELSLGAGLPDSATETRTPAPSFTDERFPAFADYAIHLFYRLTPDENEAVRSAILKGVEISKQEQCQPPINALMAHSCLTQEARRNQGYPFSRQMKTLLSSIQKPFYKTAVMVSRQNNVAWKFFPLKRDKSGQLVRDLIPALDPHSASSLGPKAAVSHRMEQVFSRGIAVGQSGYGEAHVRANPRPKSSLDSLDLFIRTSQGFQSAVVYESFIQSQRNGIDRYLKNLGMDDQLTTSQKDALIIGAGEKADLPTQLGGRGMLPPRFRESSEFKMALFWAEFEKRNYSSVRDKLNVDASKDEKLTIGCLDSSCALDRLLKDRLVKAPEDQAESLRSAVKAVKAQFANNVLIDDLRGLSAVPIDDLGNRQAALNRVRDRIDDPSINSEFSVDCVSCHVSHFESYTADDDPLLTEPIPSWELSGNSMYMTNQFSYYRDIPIVSRRVQNETLEQLAKF